MVDVLDDGFRRLAADHDPDRIAGDEMDQDEREQRHAHDHGHALKDPLDEIGGDGNSYDGDASSSGIYFSSEASSSRHHPVRSVWKFLTWLRSPVRAGEKNSATP